MIPRRTPKSARRAERAAVPPIAMEVVMADRPSGIRPTWVGAAVPLVAMEVGK